MRALWLLFLWLLFAGPVLSQTVKVQSGEHDGFSRLVLDFHTPVQWRFGRTTDGYELQVDRQDVRFDLTQAFDRIPKSRLAAIWADPVTNNLHIGIGCACHAIPFEFRPGILVVDLRDGPPPEGSSFEASLAPETANAHSEPVRRAPPPRPRQTSAYDWRVDDFAQPPTLAPGVAFDAPRAGLAPLRDGLLRQLSDGAARGVVEMALPDQDIATRAGLDMGAPLPQIRIGEQVGFPDDARSADTILLRPDGASCIGDSQLAVQDWGLDAPIIDQFVTLRSGLIGEFDKPSPEAVEVAVRLYLFLGFGREVRQLLQVMESKTADRSLWETMARVLDDESQDEGAFAEMEACDTAAALWSVLARPNLPLSARPNLGAVQRSFSALPLHLRHTLGPGLVDRLVRHGDEAAARAIGDAILRAPGEHGPEIALMDAELADASGDHGAAEQTYAQLAKEGGPVEAQALIADVSAQLRRGLPVDPASIAALDALVFEFRNDALASELRKTHALALASVSDFDGAFSVAADLTEIEPRLWEMLAAQAGDAAFLQHSFLAGGTVAKRLSLEVRRQIAERLLALGFPDPAGSWVEEAFSDQDAAEADRLLAARIALGRRDGRTALRLLAGLDDAVARTLRGQAHLQIGTSRHIPEDLAGEEDPAILRQAALRARDWQQLARLPGAAWQAAAALSEPASATAPADGAAPGSLSRARQILEESAAARATLEALLGEVGITQPEVAIGNDPSSGTAKQ